MMVGTFPRSMMQVPDKVDVLADTPSQKIYHCSILIKLFDHLLHEDWYDLFHKMFLMDFCAPEVRPLLVGHVDAFKH